jgi:hypothetical protein
VSIVTLSFVVFSVEGTPLSLEVKHIEVKILLHEMNNPRLNIPCGMGKGTVLTILAVL